MLHMMEWLISEAMALQMLVISMHEKRRIDAAFCGMLTKRKEGRGQVRCCCKGHKILMQMFPDEA